MSDGSLIVKTLEDAIRKALSTPSAAVSSNIPLSIHQIPGKQAPENEQLPESNQMQPGKGEHDFRITAPFGEGNLRGHTRNHHGTDIGMSEGTPVYAIDRGKISWSGWQDPQNPKAGGGIYVKVSHEKGKDSFYMHLSKPLVSVGDWVNMGQLVGYSGGTGDVTGPHLHLEVRQNGTPRAATGEEIALAEHGRSGSNNA